jgi:hypothetical protein
MSAAVAPRLAREPPRALRAPRSADIVNGVVAGVPEPLVPPAKATPATQGLGGWNVRRGPHFLHLLDHGQCDANHRTGDSVRGRFPDHKSTPVRSATEGPTSPLGCRSVMRLPFGIERGFVARRLRTIPWLQRHSLQSNQREAPRAKAAGLFVETGTMKPPARS